MFQVDTSIVPDTSQNAFFLDSLVLRILGQNPGKMTLQGTNTYLVGMGKSRILIDCSDGNASYIKLLARVCQKHGVEHISDLLLTHGHLDHMGGIMHIRKLFPGIRIWKYRVNMKSEQSMRLGVRDLSLMKSFSVGTNAILTPLHASGHSMDHVCFQLDVNCSLQDNKRRLLFTGDCILGTGSTSFTSLQLLLATLKKLKALKSDTMFPGHGPVIVNTKCKINEYIEHRVQREQDILVIMGRSKVPIGIDKITSILYQNVTFLVRMAAKRSVLQHLMKLQEDGVVKVKVQQRTWYFWRPRNLFDLIDSTSNGS
uniref:Betalactamaselike protein putative n=1 Tax=Albugo laibachii Nc14 TaxID=890382 RepID=F0W8N8_9STRA|nr:betalactamaselike protein putative [Albugo laibachii Nc14]|eukprot:CCA17495.1 betalactamaselike protein putative [Albugo laibachii Nc14]